MRVLKFTGKAGPDVSAGQWITALFARLGRTYPVTSSSLGQETAAPAYPSAVQPARATLFVRRPLLTSLSP